MKISIITPNYNYSQYLSQLINSVVNQKYTNWEHIIVDDGSTDNSVEIIKRFSDNDDRIKLIVQENKGQTATINRALKEVSGDLICWINSDDWFCDNIFEKVSLEFTKNLFLEVLYGNGVYFKVNENKYEIRKQLPFNYKLFAFTGFGNSIMSNTVFWKSKIMDETGFFDENLVYNMDGEFFARLFWNKNVQHINIPIAFFRWHNEAKTIKNRGYNRSERYDEELYYELNLSITRLGKTISLNKNRLKFYLIYYKIKRIILRFLKGHYFQFKYNCSPQIVV